MPALVAVAHGSRDPRSAATISALVERVRLRRPGLDVRVSFLGLSTPRLSDALAAVAADGHREAVVVPLLLGDAFHARVDVPDMVGRAARRHPRLRLRVADVLGADPRLVDVALRRLGDAVDRADERELGVVLAATGSSRPAANDHVTGIASTLAAEHGWRGAVAAFATAASPTVPEAVELLRARGAGRIAVASWFLAPGLLPSRVARAALAADPAVRLAAPLGADDAVADVVLDRYQGALADAAARLAHVS
ncbi:sirohydrochlorin chelatase [Pseudonocardia acaciae]|uniref:sirohydrochlorin chelatase n=1 Tax=Pseudonocardia acaciae TaxID=551276 RepID=UPI00049160DD|nr:sirohydrochlorin chelatase [Pseudonocardia acaciae]